MNQSTLNRGDIVNNNESSRTAHEKAIRLNGPTGWVVTDKGKHRFVRLGDAARRHLLSFGGVDPKDIASATWASPCCDVTLELRSGDVKTINTAEIMEMSFGSRGRVWTSYGISPGFPVIVRNPKTGKDSELFFPNFGSLQALHFDPPSTWEKGKRVSINPQATPAPSRSTQLPERIAETPKPAAPASFEIGTRICHRSTASVDAPLNFSYGGRQATERLTGWATLTGYVEAISGPRIQIRVARITFAPEPTQARNSRPQLIPGSQTEYLNSFDYNETSLKAGSVFWDHANAWFDCE